MYWGYYTIGGIAWFILCLLVAFGARNRGRSFLGYFLLSFFLSPIIGFIVLIILGQKRA
ncbi:hypothetical protein [Breznakiella homolactica]|uniref:Uncharacterized protein n=1 Tax=Breznakiella homolactica TaxID=2798577 RepID=A0A7T7XPS8_9SPIR|nr:hypothetical protein [Breznakiella homolactica]QQO10256.1 hypothetical protein JFL75_04875 [Breznakiella homolactica]